MNNPSQPNSVSRLDYLDGLRAIAILLVCFFHFYPSLPSTSNLQFSKFLGDFSLVKYGYMGVMLFFAISGFVISKTLHSSKSMTNFFVKRLARLFPTMILCSILTFAFSFIEPRIYFSKIYNFLPSLTFLDPQIFNYIFKSNNFNWMDGAYWSLFTEVRFYAMAAIIFFYDKTKFFRNFLIVASILGLLFPFAIYFEINHLRSVLNFLLISSVLPWFTFGIGCYYLHLGENKKALVLGINSFIAISLYILAITKKPFMPFDSVVTFWAMIIIFTLLICSMKIKIITRLLSLKPLTAIGVASYSLYLLHEEIGHKIYLLFKESSMLSTLSLQLLPIVTLVCFIIISSLIYKFYERPSNTFINKIFAPKNRNDTI